MRTERGLKIKYAKKDIVEEKRSDVFRPNYVPPLAVAAAALQGATDRTVNEKTRTLTSRDDLSPTLAFERRQTSISA